MIGTMNDGRLDVEDTTLGVVGTAFAILEEAWGQYWFEIFVLAAAYLFWMLRREDMKNLREDRILSSIPQARKRRESRKGEKYSDWRGEVNSAVVRALPGPCRTSNSNSPASTPRDYAVKNPFRESNENSYTNGDLSPVSARLTMSSIRAEPVQAVEALMELSRNRNNGRVIEVFRLMQIVGVDSEICKHIEGTRYTIYMFYIAICQAFIRTNMPNSVSDVITHMREVSGVERTYEFYESVMRILAAARKHREAISIYDELTKDGMKPQPHMLTCLVNFSFDLGLYQQCRDFFQLLKAEIIAQQKSKSDDDKKSDEEVDADGSKIDTEYTEKLSTRVVVTQFRVFSKLQLADEAVELLKQHQELLGEAPDKLAVNVTLGILVNKYRIDEAWAILNQFSDSLDTVSYNTIMKGYSRTKRAREALALLDQMESTEGIFPTPNLISYNTVADAFMRINHPDAALAVVHRSQRNGIKSDMFTCSILVKGIDTTSNPQMYLSTCCEILNVIPTPIDAHSTTNQVRLFQCVLTGCCQHAETQIYVEPLIENLTRNIPAARIGAGNQITYVPVPQAPSMDPMLMSFRVSSNPGKAPSDEKWRSTSPETPETQTTTSDRSRPYSDRSILGQYNGQN